MLKLTLLLDDFNGKKRGFRKSYGFSLLIELKRPDQQEKVILFDCGTKPDDMYHNLQAYGRKAEDLDAIILSHNHYDHTDGIFPLIERNPNLPVFVHKDWNKPHSFKGKHIPESNLKIIKKGRNVSEVSKSLFLTNSFYSSDYSGIYEHAIILLWDEKVILITGCCHPGLITFLNDFGNIGLKNKDSNPIQIMGGFHGFKFSTQEAKKIDARLEAIYPCHCTSHYTRFKKQFRNKCSHLKIGQTLDFK